MSNLRQRKPVQEVSSQQPRDLFAEDETILQQDPPDLRPDLRVVVSLLFCLITIIITYWYYRVDLNSRGPFSTFVNDRIIGHNPYERAQSALYPGAAL